MPPENLRDTDVDRPVHENGNGSGNGNKEDPDLDLLIEIAESQQVPALLRGADATHTIAGVDGPRWRFQGEGTPEGDEVLLRSARAAIKQMDAKREAEKSSNGG